jgi:glycosyltransferase involved in cell wall biosynthesis
MISVSIIVPVHNGGEAFLGCLDGLARNASDADEIIIVADGETDGIWRQAYASSARVLVNKTRMGPAASRNRGAEAATGDVLLFIDADVSIQPDTVRLFREAFQVDSGLAAVFGSYDDEPAAKSFLSRYRNLLHHFTHQRSDKQALTFWCGCGAIRRDLFKSAFGFDDDYAEASVEDIELGYRLTNAGHRIELHRDIQVKHLKKWDAATMIRTDVFARAIPWTELILSYREMPRDLNLRTENRLSVVLVYGIIVLVLVSIGFPSLLLIAGFLAALFVVLNLPFYRLLMRKHGVLFTLAAIPWHAFYYFYSGVGFLLGAVRFLGRNLVSGARVTPAAANRSSGYPDATPKATWEDISV